MNPTLSFSSKLKLNIFSLLFLSLGSISIVLAQTPTMTKSFTMNGAGNVEMDISSGGVTVEGNSGNQVEIELFLKKNGKVFAADDPMVDRFLEGYELTMEQHGETIEIYCKRINRSREWQRTSIKFHLSVPTKMSSDISTSGGGIRVGAMEGNQKLRSSGGGIKLDNISGWVKARSSGGGIQVSNQTGEVDIQTSGGGITITEAQGNIIASTSGGSVVLENVSGTVDAHSSGGGIRVNGEVGALKAVTSGGGIKVDITGLNEKLYLRTSGGGIRAIIPNGLGLDLELRSQGIKVDLPRDFSGTRSRTRIEGAVNGGGIPLYMQASGGNITCDFQ